MYKRKDGLWADSVTVEGEKRPRYFYGKTQAEVKKKIAAFRSKQTQGVTIAAALEEWYESREKLVSYKTLEGYRSPIKRITSAFGDVEMDELSPAQIKAFINGIAKQGFKRTTVQRPLDVLRMCYDYYITKPGSKLRDNPCASVRMPDGLTQESRELITEEQRQKVLNGLKCDFGLYAYFIMFTGLRDGEALAIKREDIDDNCIRVCKSVSWQPNQPVIKEPKTENGVRTVPLLAPLAEVLPKRWNGYLFSADGGQTPLTQTEFRRRWAAYCKQAGLATPYTEERESIGKNGRRVYKRTVWKNDIVPYQLRHEFATICFDAEIDPKDAAEIMGHSDEQLTRKIYTHIRESRREDKFAKLKTYVKDTY